jgi:signal peptidase I
MKIAQKIGSIYTLSKTKKVLKRSARLYRQKKKTLDASGQERIQSLLITLQSAILQNKPEIAERTAKQLEEATSRLMPKSTWDRARDFIGAIGFALLIAIAIRQMWFEFYSIPTGSMRPTLKEGDYLVVSKTDYGINTPLRSGHFYFDPSLIQRGSIIVFTGENMDMPDDDTMHFYIIPGKKQYIKRLIGKPGDTLYFYGGEIYGIDAMGERLQELRDPAYFKELEHIPFIRFEGKVETPTRNAQGLFSTAVFYQMNEAVAKLNVSSIGTISGEMIAPKTDGAIHQYSDLWGFKNYGMSRLLTRAQANELHPKEMDPDSTGSLDQGVLYLEVNHHPSLLRAHLVRDEMGRTRPALGTSVSLLPLTKEHVENILMHMTTARFEVRDERVYRYGSGHHGEQYRPELAGVPNGMYEIQDGKASEILWGGVAKRLPKTHPLLSNNPEQIQTLYNLGFEWSNHFKPAPNSPLPSRYAYFRNGDLYLMGGAVLKKGDPFLTLFLKREYEKQSMSTTVKPYFPFDDAGPPVAADGKIDSEFIKEYGLTIPEGMYLAMGDNHAMSADSRQFGFVPEANLRGGASFLFWPAGDRWGRLSQAAIAHMTFPNLTIWLLAIGIGSLSYLYIQRRYFKPFKF